MRKLLLAAVGAASMLLGACGSTDAGTITLNLQHLDCDLGDALQGAVAIEVVVSGPGMGEVTASGPISAGSLDLPEIPAGKDRQVTVRATNGADVNATLLAIGRSAKFEVKATESRDVDVPMTGLNRTHPPAPIADPSACSVQAVARAGHASAAFSDGRALLVGGFVIEGDPETVRYLDDVELYEPATGAFRSLGKLPSICGDLGNETCERAFAPAVVQKVPNNGERLLVVGGEYVDGTGAVRARGEILVFDGTTEAWTKIPLLQARRHHTATLMANNAVYVVGGFGNPATAGDPIPVVGPTEFVQPNLASSSPGPAVPRALHGAVATADGKLLVAGGVDADLELPNTVLQLTPGSSNVPALPATLTNGVVGPKLAVFWKRLAVIGGVMPDASFDLTDPLFRIPEVIGPTGIGTLGEIVYLDGTTPPRRAVPEYPLQVKRSFACAAPIDANRLLVAGGVSEVGGVVTNGGSVEVLAWIDGSQCLPKNDPPCVQDSQCGPDAACIDGQCFLPCTDDAICGGKGTCTDGFCKSDLTNPAHRCTVNGGGCFQGSACVEGGRFDRSFIGGSNPTGSKLDTARAWAACTRLSDDQILITGGVSEAQTHESLGAAELYEITHAGR